MSLRLRAFSYMTSLLVLILLGLSLLGLSTANSHAKPAVESEPLLVASVESLGVVTFNTGYEFAGTEVGGLSGIAYDPQHDVYYVVSDNKDAPRYYTVAIELGPDGALDEGDVTFLDVTSIRNQTNAAFPDDSVDAESIVLPRPGFLFISSEGDAESDPTVDPFVNQFNTTGRQVHSLPVPAKFLPGGANGIRNNLAFESLTTTPDQRHLYTAVENALVNDGPRSTLDSESPSRVLEYNLKTRQPGREFVYIVAPIPVSPIPIDGFADNGLVELEALDNQGTFLAMERSFAVGAGNTIRLFETSTAGATDVSAFTVLGDAGAYEPMRKALVADFEADLGINPDNLEAMRFGPTLPDGRRLLVVVSDNNFNPVQSTQFIALAVELAPESVD